MHRFCPWLTGGIAESVSVQLKPLTKQSSGFVFVFVLERGLWNTPTLRVICSGKYVVQHVPMHVGQAKITATMSEGQFLVIDS